MKPILKALGMVLASFAVVTILWAAIVYTPERFVLPGVLVGSAVFLFIYFYREFKKESDLQK